MLDKQITAKIKQVINMHVVKKLKQKQVPSFNIPIRRYENILVKKDRLVLGNKMASRRLDHVRELRPFMQLSIVSKEIFTSLSQGIHPTVRNIFYRSNYTIPGTRTDTFKNQTESNKMIEEVELLTGYTREQIGILSDTRGKIHGDMEIESKGKRIRLADLGDMVLSIHPLVDRIKIINVNADYVLVVEKDAIFTQLVDLEFWRTNKCVLITGHGQPDRATRRMVNRLNSEWELPIYVLTDSDPYGFYIYSVYKIGSINLAYVSDKLATPEAKFLGVSVSDMDKYKLPKVCRLSAKPQDLKRAMELKNYKWFQSKQWQRELRLFLRVKQKAEIDALAKLGYDFIPKRYIPVKISRGDFID